ncbi:MAG: hypothetical protein Ta2A_10840 [Treponemataceae bacterium]|nr:MAG: hypothetical protein Ta2A_10840 [Treponemataceae bacterium]
MKALFSRIVLFCVLVAVSGAQDTTALLTSVVPPQSETGGNPVVSIRYIDKTIYYPGASLDNPVKIQVTVTNGGSSTLRFKLADDRIFSMDFVARTLKSAQLPKTDMLVHRRTTSTTVYFREIALEAGEAYSFVENLKDYLVISEPSIYYLELQFYPDLYKSPSKAALSNRLTLEVQPSPSVASSNPIAIQGETLALLSPEAIPPDQAVEQTIVARQKHLWDEYFLYMDVEEMLMKDGIRNRRYRSASAGERARMIANFKADLMQTRIERDIVAIPTKFQIERTVYSQSEGTVQVLEWFRYDTFIEKKRYTYYVKRRDNIWMIYDYIVENLGTE